MLSNSRITRIGELLKESKEDVVLLTELEQYRTEFIPSYNFVVSILSDNLGLSVTGRSKSTISIVEKLRRGSIRLSQIQDIVGCRVIADSLSHQDHIVDQIRFWFPDARVHDKRTKPVHGYRAVHVLVVHEGRLVEIQVRTRLQHFWANRSEKLADKYGQGIKYGTGDAGIVSGLAALSDELFHLDELSQQLGRVGGQISDLGPRGPKDIWKRLRDRRKQVTKDLSDTVRRAKRLMQDFIHEED